MASTSRIWLRIYCCTSPWMHRVPDLVISTNLITAGVVFAESYICQPCQAFIGGRELHLTLKVDGRRGAMAASALPSVTEFNKVLLPTLGRPTIPNFIVFFFLSVFLHLKRRITLLYYPNSIAKRKRLGKAKPQHFPSFLSFLFSLFCLLRPFCIFCPERRRQTEGERKDLQRRIVSQIVL